MRYGAVILGLIFLTFLSNRRRAPLISLHGRFRLQFTNVRSSGFPSVKNTSPKNLWKCSVRSFLRRNGKKMSNTSLLNDPRYPFIPNELTLQNFGDMYTRGGWLIPSDTTGPGVGDIFFVNVCLNSGASLNSGIPYFYHYEGDHLISNEYARVRVPFEPAPVFGIARWCWIYRFCFHLAFT